MSSKKEIGIATKKVVLSIVLSIFIGIIINSSNITKNYTEISVMTYGEDELYNNSGVYDLENMKTISNSEGRYNIIEKLKGLTSAYKISVDGENIGYISTDEKVNNILAALTNIYIDKMEIEKKDVITTDIKCGIDVEKVIVSIPEISTVQEIAKEIYSLVTQQKDELDIAIKVQEKVQEEIEPDTVVLKDDNLYKGEFEEEKGEVGIKEVFREVVYSNGKIIDKKIISENTILEPVNRVVKKGTRNPYDYGIAFLSNPTRGGYMTSGYGKRWESFHKGIDISGNLGDDVLAAIDGEVTYAQFNNGGYGNLIMIKHEDNMVTYYAHLNEIYVGVGDKINKGDVIGAIGNTGFSTGPHLHFELRVNGEAVDPTTYIVQ